MASWLLLLVQPLATRLLAHGELPPGFGVFPPQRQPGVAGFQLGAFLIFVAVAAMVVAFLVAPTLFGFRRPSEALPRPRAERAELPFWFWPGALQWLVSWWAMWSQPPSLGSLLSYTFVPLWWGFIAVLDGLVYLRTGGRSLFARRPLIVVGMALVSAIGWFYFEYLDFFVSLNWYYPHASALPKAVTVAWFGLTYTTILPSIFEFYALLRTFEGLTAGYTGGPRWVISRRGWWRTFAIGMLLNVAVVVWPVGFFWAIWIGPLLVLSALLGLTGQWTPFVPLQRGDWSQVVLIGLASLINYFLGEMWNFWSAPANPNFWQYDVPLVGVLRIFEMPVLGFFGYIPFGLFCWVWWLHGAHVLGLSPEIDMAESGAEGEALVPGGSLVGSKPASVGGG